MFIFVMLFRFINVAWSEKCNRDHAIGQYFFVNLKLQRYKLTILEIDRVGGYVLDDSLPQDSW